ncbi:hypothetical protein GW796_07215 [archaeon]|nr:hypothetical protein [archaeon]NCQ51672.1 hypothetical protein [archaeon]
MKSINLELENIAKHCDLKEWMLKYQSFPKSHDGKKQSYLNNSIYKCFSNSL